MKSLQLAQALAVAICYDWRYNYWIPLLLFRVIGSCNVMIGAVLA